MIRMGRRELLGGAFVVGVGLLAKREGRVRRWEEEVGLERGDRVSFDSWGVWGPGRDSSMQRVGPKRGIGVITTLAEEQGLIWARVEYCGKNNGETRAAWHEADTLERVED